MITIRKEQVEALRRAAHDEYIDRRIEHLREHFGPHVGAPDSREFAAQIERAIERAARHRLVSHRDVALFIDLSAHYGWDFLERDEFAWAKRDYLQNSELGTPSQRLDKLVAAAMAPTPASGPSS